MAETRLIDADEKQIIIQALKMHHDSQFTPGVYAHSVFGKAALLLESTEDAVEVVRCKDCKQWNVHGTYGKKILGECGLLGKIMNYEDFCSRGERRTDG